MVLQPLTFILAADAVGAVASQAASAIGQAASFAEALRHATVQQITAPLHRDSEPASDDLLSQTANAQDAPNDLTHLDGIRRVAESAQQQLLALFRQFSFAANIEPASEFALQLDGNGNVKSLANDPLGIQIEQLVASNPKAIKLITELIDAKRVLQAAEENPSFLDAYQRDPVLAVAQFPHLFDRAKEPVLVVRPDEDYVRIEL